MTKDTCGWGGMIGTSAALLAGRGFTGLDSEFMLTAGDLALGERWEVLEIYLKHYPCCRWSQPGIDAALRLRPDPTRIQTVVVRTFAAADLLSRRRPTNTEEMQYSLVWPIATALARGCFGVDEVLGGFDDPLVATIAGRIQVEVDPGLTRAFPARRLTELEVVSSDGATVRSGAIEAEGEPHTAGWEDVVAGKVLRFLDPDVALPLAVRREPPATTVSGRSRDELVRLLAFGLGPRRWITTLGDTDEQRGGVHPGVPARGDPVARTHLSRPRPRGRRARGVSGRELRRSAPAPPRRPDRARAARRPRAVERGSVHAVLRADRGPRVGRHVHRAAPPGALARARFPLAAWHAGPARTVPHGDRGERTAARVGRQRDAAEREPARGVHVGARPRRRRVAVDLLEVLRVARAGRRLVPALGRGAGLRALPRPHGDRARPAERTRGDPRRRLGRHGHAADGLLGRARRGHVRPRRAGDRPSWRLGPRRPAHVHARLRRQPRRPRARRARLRDRVGARTAVSRRLRPRAGRARHARGAGARRAQRGAWPQPPRGTRAAGSAPRPSR